MKPLIILNEINKNTDEHIDTIFSNYKPTLINMETRGLIIQGDKRTHMTIERDSIRRIYTFLRHLYQQNPQLAHKYVVAIGQGIAKIIESVPCEKINPENLNQLMDILHKLEPQLIESAQINIRKLLLCMKKSSNFERKLALFKSFMKVNYYIKKHNTNKLIDETHNHMEPYLRISLEKSIYSEYTHNMEILRNVNLELAKTINAELLDKLIEKLKTLTNKSPTLYLCGLPKIVEMLYRTDKRLAHLLIIQYINALSKHLENGSILSRLTQRIPLLNKNTKEMLKTLAMEMHFLIADIAEIDRTLARTLAIMTGRTIIRNLENLDPGDSIEILNVIFGYCNRTEIDILREASNQWDSILLTIFKKIVNSNDYSHILSSIRLLMKIYNINRKLAEKIWDSIRTKPRLVETFDIANDEKLSLESFFASIG